MPISWWLPLALFSACAWGAPEQTERDGATASAVALLLKHEHYAPKEIGDDLSKLWLDNYLSSLDPNRMILLASDVEVFQKKWAKGLDDDILRLKPTLEPMSAVYKVYEQRLNERLAAARGVLAGPLPLDSQDTWFTDREDAAWPATAAEANDLWRRMILDQVVRGVLLAEVKQKRPAETNKAQIIAPPELQAVASPVLTPEQARQVALTEVTDRLTKRFDRLAESTAKTSNADVLEIYLDALTSLYDPHTLYFAPATGSNFAIEVNNAVEGIGARLRYEDDYTVVEGVLPGGPAALDGRLHQGDKIVAVAQGEEPFVDVIAMRLDEVVALIRGRKGTTVRLMVIPVDAPNQSDTHLITLVRDQVVLTESDAEATVLPSTPGQPTIAVIDLPSFYSDMESTDQPGVRRGATTDVQKLLTELAAKKVDGVVLDLRNNGGGSLREAIDLTGLFIDRGPVVQVRGGDGKVEVLDDDRSGVAWRGPLVVLTSPLSASASEIVAGALQDYGRALVVGSETTHGKGSVQQIMDLAPLLERLYNQDRTDRSESIKITTQQFYRVSGSSTQSQGVRSDLVLPSPWQGLPVYESDLDHALPWGKIQPTQYKSVGAFDATLPELRRRSAERVAASADFKELSEDLVKRDKARAETEISLNLETRRAEIEEEAPELPLDEEPVDDKGADDLAKKVAEDFILQEAAAILRDHIGLQKK